MFDGRVFQRSVQDRCLYRLTNEEVEELHGVIDNLKDLNISVTQTNRLARRVNALLVLFWESLVDRDERCETSELRNNRLVIVKDENTGEYYVSERPMM